MKVELILHLNVKDDADHLQETVEHEADTLVKDLEDSGYEVQVLHLEIAEV